MKWNLSKQLTFFFLLSLSLLAFSCDNDDDDDGGSEPPTTNNLVGTWDVTSIVALSGTQEIDAEVSGTIKFNADGTGQESYSWTALGVSVQENNGFTWQSTSNTITFDPGDVDQTVWSRLINEEDRQRGSYVSTIEGQNVTITITLEK